MYRLNWYGIMAASLISGFSGSLLSNGSKAHAYGERILQGQQLTLTDNGGRRYLQIAKGETGQSSAIFIFDGKDRSRVEVGTYEDGIPTIALEGEDHTPKAILRMAGGNQSGVLVFKDKHHHDRMILGLDMENSDEQPFLVTFDANGTKKVIFGRY